MSEPKLVSPMLDNFAMGAPMSEHHGVRCCPAMPKDSDSKYIVKIISIPASQVQAEALLLTGAYPDEASLQAYFREQADNLLEDVNVLNKMSRLEGFIPYEGCQVEPKDTGIGFDVYLLSPYKQSLERFMRKNPMTHVGAVNLGLDMCASLAVCRHSGYLYADLKPGNIFISNDNEYRIGDPGFLRMDALKFTSMPERFIGPYTAPEIKDAFSALNTTIDTYAVGMILYQIYNGGALPFFGRAPEEALEAPIYADYEMAEIIMKAIDPDPAVRWEDPLQMGQALVSYMQRNGANDTPIVPPVVPLPTDEDAVPQPVAAVNVDTEATEQEVMDEEDPGNLSFMDTLENDDTAPNEETAGAVAYQEISGDAGDILTQADDLLSHETPDPIVVPEPIDVPIPVAVAVAQEEAEQEDEEPDFEALIATATADENDLYGDDSAIEDDEDNADDQYEDDYDDGSYEEPGSAGKLLKRILVIALSVILLAGLVFGGYVFYKEYYLQDIASLSLEVMEDSLRVNVTTDVDNSLLTVVCTDTYGNKLEAPVINGVATFTGLNPNTLYSVKVEIGGLHKLTGDYTDGFTTPVQTNIVSFSAVTGDTPGTAILSFTIDGIDSNSWQVTYTADGEEAKTQTFAGHTVNIDGLTMGKTYTFVLDSVDPLYIVGSEKVTYTASAPVYAQDLAITGCTEDALTVAWKAPADSSVTKWIVRCYSTNDYDKTVTVTDTTAVFTGINPKAAYTVEVTAEGMSTGERCYMSANAVTITNAVAQVQGANTITVSWKSNVAGQWLVMYTVDGCQQQGVVRSSGTTASISPIVPGATYNISIQREDNTTVFGGKITVQTPKAAKFQDYLVTADNMTFRMCKTPNKANWTHQDVKKADYTDTFKVGEKASFVVLMDKQYNTSPNIINTMYVIRDADGKLVSWDSTAQTWTSMWYQRYCELTIPAIPENPGQYTVEIYFNGGYVHNQGFQVVGAI